MAKPEDLDQDTLPYSGPESGEVSASFANLLNI